jgi:uroporphyrinogen III methyltransferase/synthase
MTTMGRDTNAAAEPESAGKSCSKNGKVWLVGAGPGDAGLLTLRGKQVLSRAEVVFYDNLVSDDVLCEIPDCAELASVGKRAGGESISQEEINRMLIDEAKSGKQVVRLKGGDPFIFGRGGEEMLALRDAGVAFEAVPGVSSAIAAPAYAGIPVTHRGISSAVHVMTWRLRGGLPPTKETLEGMAKAGGTLVILMCAGSLAELGHRLIASGFSPDMAAAFIENGTTAKQRVDVTTLAELAFRKIEPEFYAPALLPESHAPALLVVGEVCALAGEFSNHQILPLSGARIVVTRSEPQNAALCEKIRNLGGIPISFPCIKTVPRFHTGQAAPMIQTMHTGQAAPMIQTMQTSKTPRTKTTQMSQAPQTKTPQTSQAPRMQDYEDAACYEWLVFTSASGVTAFFEGYLLSGLDIRKLSACKIAAIGPVTAASLRRYGLNCDYTPQTYYAKSLGTGLAEIMKPCETALLIRAAQSSPRLNEALSEKGIMWREMPVYDIEDNYVEGQGGDVVRSGRFDFVFFASASSVDAFTRAVPEIEPESITAICIGRETAKRASELGMSVEIAEHVSTDDMCAAACRLRKLMPSAETAEWSCYVYTEPPSSVEDY